MAIQDRPNRTAYWQRIAWKGYDGQVEYGNWQEIKTDRDLLAFEAMFEDVQKRYSKNLTHWIETSNDRPIEDETPSLQ